MTCKIVNVYNIIIRKWLKKAKISEIAKMDGKVIILQIKFTSMKQKLIKDLCIFIVLVSLVIHAAAQLYTISPEAEIAAFMCVSWILSVSLVRCFAHKNADQKSFSIAVTGSTVCGLPMLWMLFHIPGWSLFIFGIMVAADLFMFRLKLLLNQKFYRNKEL